MSIMMNPGGRGHHSDGLSQHHGQSQSQSIAVAAFHYERQESSSVDTVSERTDSVYSTSPRQEAFFDGWNRKQLRDSASGGSLHGGITGRKIRGSSAGNSDGGKKGSRSKLLSGASEAARVLFSGRGANRRHSSSKRHPDPAESEMESEGAAARRAAERFIEEENAAAALAGHDLDVGRWRGVEGGRRHVVAHESDGSDGGAPAVGDGDDATMAARKEALRLQRRFLGGNDADVALTLNNIGNVYYGRGEVAEAMEAYEEALRVSSPAGVLPRDY